MNLRIVLSENRFNLTGAYDTIAVVAPHMKAAGRGSIIVTAIDGGVSVG